MRFSTRDYKKTPSKRMKRKRHASTVGRLMRFLRVSPARPLNEKNSYHHRATLLPQGFLSSGIILAE
ncbi:MAG: hypothetical protein DME76_02405 [Verrucomicrobia bacterium]|nr:MAG: hypothetical protein DME76_02405 [Verrucomicrobiota bacterium]